MTETHNRTDLVVLRTGKLLEADMAANQLEIEGIPFYRRVESSSGVELAMPLMPVQGAGTWWVIRVPREYAETAREIIGGLPVQVIQNPGVWHYGPTEKVKRFIKFSAYLSVFLMLIWFALWLIKLFSEI